VQTEAKIPLSALLAIALPLAVIHHKVLFTLHLVKDKEK